MPHVCKDGIITPLRAEHSLLAYAMRSQATEFRIFFFYLTLLTLKAHIIFMQISELVKRLHWLIEKPAILHKHKMPCCPK